MQMVDDAHQGGSGESTLVGFVGLGNMGWPMARNLTQAGMAVVVHDLDAERVARFVAEFGGRAASAPADFAGAGVVVTMLPDGRAVADAMCEWEGGIAAALAPGAVVVDMSSSNPLDTRGARRRGSPSTASRSSTRRSPAGSGAPTPATLTIMIGGDDEQRDRARARRCSRRSASGSCAPARSGRATR